MKTLLELLLSEMIYINKFIELIHRLEINLLSYDDQNMVT